MPCSVVVSGQVPWVITAWLERLELMLANEYPRYHSMPRTALWEVGVVVHSVQDYHPRRTAGLLIRAEMGTVIHSFG